VWVGLVITYYKFSTECTSEKFWESVNISQTYGQKFAAYFFGPPCIWAMSAEGRGMRRGSAMSSLVGVTINNLFHRPIGPISHVTSWNSVSMFTLDFIYFRWHLYILWCYFSICISFFTVLSNFTFCYLGHNIRYLCTLRSLKVNNSWAIFNIAPIWTTELCQTY